MNTYEKKLTLAKEALDSGSYDKETIEYIFPELKESEGEKIRKCTISLLQIARDKGFYSTPKAVNKCIAWLEKQGEKLDDKVEPKFNVGDIIEVKPMKCYGKIFTGKPNKIVDITEKSYILDDGKAYNIESQDGWKLSEQKFTEWSEYDEDMLDDLICYFDKSCGLRHLLFEVATWLKSLKDRAQLREE